MMSRHESVLSLEKSRNANDAGSEGLGLSQVHDIGLYTLTREELQILIILAENFVKNRNNPPSFH